MCFSCLYTSQKKRKSERMIRSINNTIRTLLFQARLPPTFWTEALFMVVYLLNITPSTTLQNISPYKKLFNKQSSYKHLWVFGSLCYPHIPTSHKLSPRSTPCIFLGYPSQHKGYRFLNLHTNMIIISRHVTFDETIFPYGSFTLNSTPSYTFLDTLYYPNPVASQFLSKPITSTPITSLDPTPPSSPSPMINKPLSSADSSSFNSPYCITVSSPLSPNNFTSSATSTHPMVTRARAGIHKLVVKLNLYTQSVSFVPRTYLQAFNDPN